MATFKNATITTNSAGAAVTLYACPSSGVASSVLHGLFICNIQATNIKVSVMAYNSYVVYNVVVPPGSTLEFDKPINLSPSQTIAVTCDTAAGMNVFASVLEN